MTTTTTAPLPEATPAWWLHWLNLAIAAIGFVGVAIHPGWHPPTILVEVVGPLAILLAVGSGVVFAILHARSKTATLRAAYQAIQERWGLMQDVYRQLMPLVDHVPGIESRLNDLEAAVSSAPSAAQTRQEAYDALRAILGQPAAPAPAQPPEAPLAVTSPVPAN